jgi:tetratricopeptide (TPR) repeat protein
MKTITFTLLFAAGALFSGVASAQETPTYIPPTPFTSSEQQRSDPPGSGDVWRGEPGLVRISKPIEWGVAALQANDYAKAEEIFADNLRYNSSNPTLRFYMGVAKMNLGKWDEARGYLKTAARELRKSPDPKSRLGVTYAKLGDVERAQAQRQHLVKMAEACKGTCKQSAYIADGIRLIDEAIAAGPVRD